MQPSPFWEAAAPGLNAELPVHVDVLVVGAGITGVAVARRLVGQASVLVVERSQPGSGATGRNAGFVLAGVAANYSSAIRANGRDTAREIWRFTIENHRLLAAALEGGQGGYRRRGSWVLPASPGERDQLRESAALLAEDGLPGQWHDDAPASGADEKGGVMVPTDAELHPARALMALAAPLPPGTLSAGTNVAAIEPGTGGVRVELERGSGGRHEVVAGRVVIAANGYTARLIPSLPLRPVRAQMLATAPEANLITDRPVYSDFGYRYWRQLDDGRVLLGGFRNTAFDAEVGDDDAPSEGVQARLEEHLLRLGVSAAVTHRWAGTMGFTPDELPMVGPVPGFDGVHLCGGYSGHGLGFSMHAAETLVDSWSGGTIPAWLDSQRFALAGRGTGG
jgi:glycine/D-amino acid oxidase-like deaminating enzyme